MPKVSAAYKPQSNSVTLVVIITPNASDVSSVKSPQSVLVANEVAGLTAVPPDYSTHESAPEPSVDKT